MVVGTVCLQEMPVVFVRVFQQYVKEFDSVSELMFPEWLSYGVLFRAALQQHRMCICMWLIMQWIEAH